MTEYITILVTVPDEPTALAISQKLVEASLAACGQVDGPITSIYKWKESIQTDREWRLVLKSKKTNFALIEKLILSLHPYEVPQIISLPVIDGFGPYLKWIDESLSK